MRESATTAINNCVPLGYSSTSKTNTLREKTIRGSLWILSGYGASQAIRLISNLILTRLLFPKEFGVMSLVLVFMQGLQMFSDIGIGPSIIQNSRGNDPIFLNTAWTIQVIRGWILWFASLILAYPYARFYPDIPNLIQYIPVAALVAVISGFNSTSLSTQSRQMTLGMNTLLNLGGQVVSAIVMIILAWVYHSVWALVIGNLVNAAFIMIFSHLILPGTANRFCWDAESHRALMGFGKWIFLSTMLAFLANQLDRLILGRLVPVSDLGIYNIAMIFVAMPKNIATRLTSAVLFPLLANKTAGGSGDFAASILQSRRIMLAFGVVVSLALALGSPFFFQVLYEGPYEAAGWMAQLLSIYMWFSLLQISADRALLARGDSRAISVSNVVNMAVTIVGCIAGFQMGKIAGFILGLSASSLAGHIVVQICLRYHGIHIISQDIRFTIGIGILGGIGVIGMHLSTRYAGSSSYLSMQLIWPGLILVATSLWALFYIKDQLGKRES
jgi:O-antigen/teichoic acid export membrane protein